MNIFSEIDYRKAIALTVQEKKEHLPGFTFQKLANAARLHKAYLSRVIAGKAELNSDQLHLICEHLGFDEKQRRYMGLLLEYSRSGLKARKDQLKAEILRIQSKFIDPREVMRAPHAGTELTGVGEYYLDPIYQLVHICVSIPRYNSDLSMLAQDLGITVQRVIHAVEKLEQLWLIRREKGKIKILVDDLHLPRESLLYKIWRNQIKILSLQKLNEASSETGFSYSATFSADLETRTKIQSRFLEFLKDLQELVKDAPCEETFQMNFDMFCWTKR